MQAHHAPGPTDRIEAHDGAVERVGHPHGLARDADAGRPVADRDRVDDLIRRRRDPAQRAIEAVDDPDRAFADRDRARTGTDTDGLGHAHRSRVDPRHGLCVGVRHPDCARAGDDVRWREPGRDVRRQRRPLGIDDGDRVAVCQCQHWRGRPPSDHSGDHENRSDHPERNQRAEHGCARPSRARPMSRQRGSRRGRQRGTGLPAARWVLGERAAHDAVEAVAKRRRPVARSRRVVLEVRVDRLDLRPARERRLTREALKQHATQRIEVGAAVDIPAANSLGRQVRDGADEPLAARSVPRRPDVLGHAEVGEVDVLCLVLHGHEHVARLDVAVHQAPGVCRVEGRGELADQVDRALRREPPLTTQQRSQVRALHVAHGNEQLAVGFTGLVDRHDVGVVDRRRQPRLGVKPRPERLVGSEGRGYQLQRDATPETQVHRTEDDAHAAATQHRLDAIRAQSRSDPGSSQPLHPRS